MGYTQILQKQHIGLVYCPTYTVFAIFMHTELEKTIFTRMTHASHVLLVPHKNPDGDSLGSLTCCANLLEQYNIPYHIYCATTYAQQLAFLPHVTKLSTNPALWKSITYDHIIVFDAGDLGYAGIDKHIQALSYKPTVINIDHHATNTYFGDYNLVDTESSSTCEVFYRCLKNNTATITPEMATSLLTGIITDTDNFSNDATRPQTLYAASELMNLGGDTQIIKKWVYEKAPLHALHIWGKVMQRLKKHHLLNMCYTHITHQEIDEHGIKEAHISGMVNFLNSIQDGHAGLLVREMKDGTIKGSFRTTRDDVNVAHMAKQFGGGGHKKAAGFVLPGPIDTAVAHIFETLETLFPDGSVTEQSVA